MDNSNKLIYIYHAPTTANGILVIINNLKSAFQRNGYKCNIITCLDGIPQSAIIIPYASEPAIDMIRKKYNTDIAFMTDAYSLGHLNKIKFYLKRGNFFKYDLYRSIYCYIEGLLKEKQVYKHFKRFILVSETDICYLKNMYNANADYTCVPNGANFEEITKKTESNILRLGILSSWGHKITAGENGWLILDYFRKFYNTHKNVELILAGRGNYIKDYGSISGVKIMGEVDNLNDFFKEIDVFLVANPKGCGILNRTLDAFAHKTCVLGIDSSFSGFRYMKSYLEFNNYKTFELQIEKLAQSPEFRTKLAEKAFQEITEHNNWIKNYDRFVKKISL